MIRPIKTKSCYFNSHILSTGGRSNPMCTWFSNQQVFCFYLWSYNVCLGFKNGEKIYVWCRDLNTFVGKWRRTGAFHKQTIAGLKVKRMLHYVYNFFKFLTLFQYQKNANNKCYFSFLGIYGGCEYIRLKQMFQNLLWS